MTRILVIGDSHCNQFKDCANAVHYKNTTPFTAQRFVDNFPELWDKMIPWLQSHKDEEYRLFLSVSEIDIRGHYWRHFPRQDQTIDSFVEAICQNLFNRIQSFIKEWRITRCVLWGPPPASYKTKNNPHWPFSGSVDVRNKMINVYNRTMINLIENHSAQNLSFATGFYDHIATDSYQPLDHIPTDGVHWHNNLTHKFWDELITPAFEGKAVSLNNTVYDQMKTHSYHLDHKHTEENSLNDAWIKTDHCHGDHCRQFAGSYWEYREVKDTVFRDYDELTLSVQV